MCCLPLKTGRKRRYPCAEEAPACTIGVLAEAVRGLFCSQAEIRTIGIRHGEKMYETLLTNEECAQRHNTRSSVSKPCRRS